ncbi:MAG: C1 family peptidase [Bacteroidota bacterium]
MKKYLLIALLLAASMPLVAQHHQGPTNLTGQINTRHKGKLLKMKLKTAVTFVTPPAVDLTNWAPEPITQSYKNCYAYATVYTARTMLYNFTNQITNHPESSVFSTAFLQKMLYPRSRTCRNNGADTYYASQVLQKNGVIFRDDFADDCTDAVITTSLLEKAKKYRVIALQLYKECDNAETKVIAIKSSLTNHRPVVVAWLSTNSFNGGGYGMEIWKPTANELNKSACRNGSNHAFCIIGYDDNKFGGAFHIQNSWSLGWGIQDRAWITYKDMAQFSAFAIEFSEPAR